MKFSLIGILNDNLEGFIDIIIYNLKEYDIILTTGVVTLLRVIFETQPGLSGYIINQLTVPINKTSETVVTQIPVEGIYIYIYNIMFYRSITIISSCILIKIRFN